MGSGFLARYRIGEQRHAEILDHRGSLITRGTAVVVDGQHVKFRSERSHTYLKHDADTLVIDGAPPIGIQLMVKSVDGATEFDVWV